MYIGYEIYLKTPCCKKEVKIALFDYRCNAVRRRNQLIETFGKTNVRIEKYIKK
jgi:hypothetical protein